jgi:hypothetical protein
MGLRSGLCAGQSSSSTPISTDGNSRECISTAPESNGGELTLGIVHGDLRLVCGYLALKLFSLFSWQRVTVLTLLPDAIWNSVVCVPTKDRRFLGTMRFRTRWSHSVSLCGLPLRGWAVVAPRRFHFTIAALTVDQGSSIWAEIWWTDLLERWHPMTVSRWMSLSSSLRPFYCQCFVHRDCMAVCLILYICPQQVWLKIAESTNLKWCPHSVVYTDRKSEVYIHLSQIHLNSVSQFLTFNPCTNSLF